MKIIPVIRFDRCKFLDLNYVMKILLFLIWILSKQIDFVDPQRNIVSAQLLEDSNDENFSAK